MECQQLRLKESRPLKTVWWDFYWNCCELCSLCKNLWTLRFGWVKCQTVWLDQTRASLSLLVQKTCGFAEIFAILRPTEINGRMLEIQSAGAKKARNWKIGVENALTATVSSTVFHWNVGKMFSKVAASGSKSVHTSRPTMHSIDCHCKPSRKIWETGKRHRFLFCRCDHILPSTR